MATDGSLTQEPKVGSGKLYWSTAMDDCMLDIFLAHLAQGHRTPSGWKKTITHTAIKEALMNNLGIDISLKHIDNRVKTWRTHILAFKTLNYSCSGFGWNPDTMLLETDERVWKEALKANDNLKSYKKKVLPRFNDWIDVLGESLANGNIQRTCFTTDVDAHDVDISPQQAFDSLLGDNRSFETVNLDDDCGSQRNHDSSTVSQSNKTFKLPQRKRKTMAARLKEEMGNMRNAMESFVDVMKEKNHYEDIIWDQISNAIFAIDGMDEDNKVMALELFSGERVDNLKRCFLRIPEHKRKEWILNKLDYGSEV